MLKNEYSLTEKVYQNLRSDILSGTFRDQEELRETALAKTYGVSRTPVREAIRSWRWRALWIRSRTGALMYTIFMAKM